MTQAQQALAAIQAYVARQPSEDVRVHGRHVWEAVIQGAEGYDEEATAEADPSHTNEEAVFADGSRLGGTLRSMPGKPAPHPTRCAWNKPVSSANMSPHPCGTAMGAL